MKSMAEVLVIQAKGKEGGPMISSLGCCFFSYVVALYRREELPLGTPAYQKIGKLQENWPRVP